MVRRSTRFIGNSLGHRLGLLFGLSVGPALSLQAIDEVLPAPPPPPARDVLLDAPFSALRLSFFHAALEVPPLETARTLPPGFLFAQIDSSHARSRKTADENGIGNTFDGIFHEWAALDVMAGILPRLEGGVRIALSGWDEQKDVFFLFDEAGNPIVSDEAPVITGTGSSQRHDNVSDIVVKLKGLLLEEKMSFLDLSLLGSVKFPIARERDLTNAGTFDLNIALLASKDFGPVTVHVNAGGGFPIGENNLFVDSADVDLNPFFQGGIGVTWRALERTSILLQLEGNTSAFKEVDFLDGGPLTIFGGARQAFGDFFIEAGAGAGLLPDSSYDFAVQVGVGYLWGWR